MHSSDFAKEYDRWALVPSFATIIIFSYCCGKYDLGFCSCILVTWGAVHILGRRLERYIRALDNGTLRRVLREQQMNSEDGRESAEWLNQVMNAAWDCQRKVWSERLRAKLDGLLEMNKPKYLEDIYVDQLGLGENSPKFHSVAAHRIKRQANTNNFEMVIDAKFSYEASTANVVFVTKLRAIGVSMSLSLGSIRLMGEARITLLWHPGSATLKGMELSLRSYPTLDYVMRPLNTFDATEIPLLSGWLTDTLSTLIKNSVVNPNKICIDLSSHTIPNCDDTDQFGEVIGHIMIACPSLDNLEFFKKSSIRYSIDVTLQSPSRVQDSTSTVISTTGLTTMVVRARNETLTITVYAEGPKSSEPNLKRKREPVGEIRVPLIELMTSTDIVECTVNVIGLDVNVPIRYLFQARHKMQSIALSDLSLFDYGAAIARLDLQSGFIDWKASVGSPILRVYLHDKLVFTSRVFKRSAIPIINQVIWLPLANVYLAALTFELLDANTEKLKLIKKDECKIASAVVPLSNIIAQNSQVKLNNPSNSLWVYLEGKSSSIPRVHRLMVSCEVFALPETGVTFAAAAPKDLALNQTLDRQSSGHSSNSATGLSASFNAVSSERVISIGKQTGNMIGSGACLLSNGIGNGAKLVGKTVGRLASPSLGRLTSPSFGLGKVSPTPSMERRSMRLLDFATNSILASGTDPPSTEDIQIHSAGEMDTLARPKTTRVRTSSVSSNAKKVLQRKQTKDRQSYPLKVYIDIVGVDDFLAPDKSEPDTYVTIKINGVDVYRTKTVHKTTSPVFDDSIEFNVSSRDILALRVKDKGKQIHDTGTISLLVEDLAMDKWERKTIKLPLHEQATLTVVVMKTSKYATQPACSVALNGVADYTQEPQLNQSTADFPARNSRRTLSPTNMCGSIERFKEYTAGSHGDFLMHRRSQSAVGAEGPIVVIRRTGSAELATAISSESLGSTELTGKDCSRTPTVSDHEHFIDTSLLETICGSIDDVSATDGDSDRLFRVSQQSSLNSTTESLSTPELAHVRRDSNERKRKSKNYYSNAQMLDKVTGMKPLDKTASLLTSMTKNRFSTKAKVSKSSSTPVGMEIQQSTSHGE